MNNTEPQAGKFQKLACFGYTCLLLAWLIGYFSLLVRLYLNHQLFFYWENGQLHYSDYLLWYIEAKLGISADRIRLYDHSLLLQYWNIFFSPHHVDTAPAFQYPPNFVLVMLPIALLPLAASYTAWAVLSALAGMLALYLVLKQRAIFKRKEIHIFLLAVAASLPSWISLRTGQLAWFYLAFLAFYAYGLISKKNVLAAFSLAIISTKPQYLAFLLLPALGQKRWQLLAYFAVVEVALLGAASWLFGIHNLINYPAILVQEETSAAVVGVHPDQMISLRALLSYLLPPAMALSASAAFMLVSLALLAVLWWKLPRQNPQSQIQNQIQAWAMALTIILALLGNAHAHIYDALFLALPAALTIPCIDLFSVSNLKSLVLKFWSSLFILSPLFGICLFVAQEVYDIYAWRQPFIISLIIILLICAALHLRDLLRSAATDDDLNAGSSTKPSQPPA